jgi:hypothetical protein
LDNDDFKDDTLTGANTLYQTNIMCVQTENVVMDTIDTDKQLSIAKAEDMKQLCLEQNRIVPYKMVKCAEIDITHHDSQEQKNILIHGLVCLAEEGSTVPADVPLKWCLIQGVSSHCSEKCDEKKATLCSNISQATK